MFVRLPPRRALRRHCLLFGALGALLATLALGAFGPPLGGLWTAIRATPLMPLTGLAAAGGAGLLAYHLAGLATARCGLAEAALPAALMPVTLLPAISAVALLVPLILSAIAASRDPRQRVVALIAHCGAATWLAGAVPITFKHGFVFATMLGAAWIAVLLARPRAANDNPSLERIGDISWLPVTGGCASGDERTRKPRLGE